MKLGRRAGLLILPVLTLGYLLAFAAMYQSQRSTLFRTEQLLVELQLAELSDSLTRYANLTRNYLFLVSNSNGLAALLQATDPAYRALAVDRSLQDAIDNLGLAQGDPLSIAVVTAAGEVEFVYGQDADPFAEGRLPQANLVADVFHDGVYQRSIFTGLDTPAIMEVRIVDRYTLRPPVEAGSPDAVALVVGVEAHSFRRRLEALSAAHRRLVWLPGEVSHEGAVSGAGLSKAAPIGSFGELRLEAPMASMEGKLATIRIQLAAAFALLTALSYLALTVLIRRYITVPIKRLERDLSALTSEGREQLYIHEADDEIGKLSKKFASLYEDLRKSYQITREMAERDGLTRLYNRRMFNHLIERHLDRARADGGKVALLYIDVDNFKYINDKFGHGVGDELLRTFADRMTEVLRPTDPVYCGMSENCSARLAGDEFAVILYGFEDDDVPRKVAERLLTVCDSAYLTPSARVSVSLSIGVACFPQDADNPTALISSADSAMYQAKNGGKSQYSFYSRELAEKARRAVEIEARLKKLNYSELSLNYMPVFHAASGSVVGFEALLRWDSASLGVVPPEEFIPIAESIGAYREIDRWVITHASDDLPMLQQHYGPDIRVSVNISSAELESREFLDEVTMMVRHGFIRPEHMELEITETFHVNQRHDSESILAELRALGFCSSIDDFGTGFTSLIQLVEYEIDKIKLDRSFVGKVLERERVEVIASLVQICASQRFAVTAEGVETSAQAAALRAAGCDYLQGFYFLEPVTLEHLVTAHCIARLGSFEQGQSTERRTAKRPAPLTRLASPA